MAHPRRFFANGLNGNTGQYLVPPMDIKQAVAMIRGATADERLLRDARAWNQRKKEPSFAPMAGVDPKKLSESGWGVIFAYNTDPAVREASGNSWRGGRDRRAPSSRSIPGRAATDRRTRRSKRSWHGWGPGTAASTRPACLTTF